MVEVLPILAKKESSRNGPVLTITNPFCLEITHPEERVLFDPYRDANPFFHMMEFIWMMAGSNQVAWLSQFNKRMAEYSDDGHIFHAAYGHRWRKAFGCDQIQHIVAMLTSNKSERRAVMAMWSPTLDFGIASKDLPCNTQIMFRMVLGSLDMTVVNRSNDMIWGMFGANAVHMTMLHELISRAIGVPTGVYRVFTTNLHVYPEMPRFQEIMDKCKVRDDRYATAKLKPFPLLGEGEKLQDFLRDSEEFILTPEISGWRTNWFLNVAQPFYRKFMQRDTSVLCMAQDWQVAGNEWLERRMKVEK
jgi:hypothetical protein